MPYGEWNTGRGLPQGLCRLLLRQSGVIGRIQALRYLTPGAVRQLVESGRWARPYRSVLVAHNGPLTPEQELWGATLSVGAGRPALLGGRTALQGLGLKGFPSDHIHVVIVAARKSFSPPPGVVVHRTTTLSRRDVSLAGHPSTRVARSVVDAASWARSDDEARTVVAMTFQQGLTTLADIDEVLARLPRVRRRALTAQMARDADAGAHSLGELHAVRLIRQAGLPEPTLQRPRHDAAGRLRYLDLYWEKYGLHVEIDGSHHLDVRHAWADARRANAVWIAGDRILRFPAFIVREQPAQFLYALRHALRAAGWLPDLG